MSSSPSSAPTLPAPLGNYAHLLPPSWKRVITGWLDEDTPSFDYGGFVVGEGEEEATLWGKSEVSSTLDSLALVPNRLADSAVDPDISHCPDRESSPASRLSTRSLPNSAARKSPSLTATHSMFLH